MFCPIVQFVWKEIFIRETCFLLSKFNFRARIFFFNENDKILPELFQLLKYARFYAKEQFFMKIMLKAHNYARSGHTSPK